MRISETSKFRLQFSIGFFFVLLTISAVLIAGYTNLQKASSGMFPDRKDAYYQSYFPIEDKYYNRNLTHSEMNEAIDVEFDSVRVVGSDWIHWQRVNRETGDKILSLVKSIRHEKRTFTDLPGNSLPSEFEIHYVRDRKIVLKIYIPLERDFNPIEILGYDFKVPSGEATRFQEIIRALKEAKGLE